MDLDKDLTEYAAVVKDYAEKRRNYVFHNNGPKHASIILKNIFDNATSIIRIAADELSDEEVVDTPEYINAIKNFLNKEGTKLYILLTQYNKEKIKSKTNSFLKTLATHKANDGERVIVKDGKGKQFKFQNPETKEFSPVNFTTADDHMYRLETDTLQKSALCNFGDTKQTAIYNKIFDDAFSNIVPNSDIIKLKEDLIENNA